jgi:hypothetical protein
VVLLGTVALACNPSYLGGKDQEGQVPRPVPAKSLQNPYLKQWLDLVVCTGHPSYEGKHK